MYLRAQISVCVALAIVALFVAPTAAAISLSPSLEKFIDRSFNSNQDSLVSVVVFADGYAASQQVKKLAANSLSSLSQTHRRIVENLRASSPITLSAIKSQVRNIYPQVNIREFWVVPAISFSIPRSKIEVLSRIEGISLIMENLGVDFIAPIETVPVTAKIAAASNHLAKLHVPALWNRGFKGQGRLVCSFDTGVEKAHPALQSKWRGNHVFRSAAWFAPSAADTLPVDKVGHGTHTMGLMVGNTATDSFGVAPEAEWITAAVIDQGQTLSRTISDILAAFQWAIDPDGDPSTTDDVPDVILNSWGIPTSILPPCNETFYQVIDNVEAAGIVTIFAAGNEGPTPKSLRLPANRATSPLNSFAVGAIDDAVDTIASFSSRGPSSCDTTQLKPEVVAPGVSIYSSYKGGTYRIMTGTSMAAPYIAGIVALLRQYNPNATVAEIKNAIALSCRDLGRAGEDNMYGYGLPDAEKALSYLPMPPHPEVYLVGQIVGGDGIADPGETFDFFVRVNLPAGTIDSMTGTLTTSDSQTAISSARAQYIFEPGITYSINIVPFVIHFGQSLINGQNIPFKLIFSFPGSDETDTLDLQITVGRAPGGHLLTHVTPRFQMTVSDFGQFGLGPRSVYPAGGVGFDFEGSENLLYEAGIIIGRSELQISSSVRDSLGRADRSDFCPIVSLSPGHLAADGSFQSYSKFIDSRAKIAIPITVSQTITTSSETGRDNFAVIRYYLINNSIENLSGLYFGFLTDFDLKSNGDRAGLSSVNNLLYQTGDSMMVGILPLTAWNGIMTLENGAQKITLSNSDKMRYINQVGTAINDTSAMDLMTVNSFGPYTLKPHDSVEIALAIVASGDLSSLMTSAQQAQEQYNVMTDVENEQSNRPVTFQLHQNYPNPFNPSTTISFDLSAAAPVRLTVHNILGETVARIIDGSLGAGKHSVIWDGNGKDGQPAASGIYFYRLEAGSEVSTRKMLMIK